MLIKDLICELEKLDGEKTIGMSIVEMHLDQPTVVEFEKLEIYEGETIDYVIEYENN